MWPALALGLATLVVGGVPPAVAAPVPPAPPPVPAASDMSASSAGATTGGAPGLWALSFSDEFDGRSVNRSKWSNGFGWGHASGNTYGWCDPDNNAVSGGLLRQTIEARPQQGRPFSVGCLHTKDHFSQRWGYWETRIWMAGCAGARGAFWAKPADESWPPELDVVEVHGQEPTRARLTLHWQEGRSVRHSQERVEGPDFTAGFHTFGAEWTPTGTIWFVDGMERRRTHDGADALASGGPFYTILNAQVFQADSACGRDGEPAHQYVDYVRVWNRRFVPDAVPPVRRDTPAAPLPCSGAGPVVAGRVLPPGTGEASGMVASTKHPGWGYFIRDSGNPASLYAFHDGGNGIDRVREIPVVGARNHDWEDLVYDTGPDGRTRLRVIESGQDGTHRYIYEIPEPDPERDQSARAVRYRYAYPDLSPNTEAALMIDGRLTLVTKTSPARLYRFTDGLVSRVLNIPRFVGTLPGADRVSVVRLSKDRRLLVAASHQRLHVFAGPGPSGFRPLAQTSPARSVRALGRYSAVEGGDWFPAGGCRLLLLSENRSVLAVDLASGFAGGRPERPGPRVGRKAPGR